MARNVGKVLSWKKIQLITPRGMDIIKSASLRQVGFFALIMIKDLCLMSFLSE